MKRVLFLLGIATCTLYACHSDQSQTKTIKKDNTAAFKQLLNNYWEERMQLFPMDATANGDYRYDDKMTITIANSFIDSTRRFYQKYLNAIDTIDSSSLSAEDQLSYRIFKYEMNMDMEGLKFPTNYMPINQFWSPTLDLPMLGSGKGNQPFKTVKDYNDFLKRLSVFSAWTDTAIYNMRQGIKTGWVLPKALVIKVIPQLKAIVVKDPTTSIFYDPIKNMPDSFSDADKKRLTTAYTDAINNIIVPSYQKLYNFFKDEYLPHARTSTGVDSLPGGREYYRYCARYWTTTNMTPDSIYNLGLQKVALIKAEMIKVMKETGYKGDLHSFFTYLNTDKKFFPFSTPKEVLDSFWNIKKAEGPQLKKLFNHVPKSPFTIRQTEAFRAASASAEYNPPSADGSRPGIFYVPILDAKKFNAVGMETLFLHEAIPGHHYQISLQQENKDLPQFRRFLWYGAYGEGWALYSESLGKELGLYKNPYQYFGHLSDAIHRAIRLVVDVGMHYKGMTREEAIKYMMDNERATKDEATAEIERYMAIPGQALSYKIGQLTITSEREKYEKELGSKFDIAAFHDEVLKDGCVPLSILREKLDSWAKKY